MQKRVRELLFQCFVQPYILLFCFELKSLCILFPLSFYLAKSLNSCSDTQPDSCAEWSKAAVRSNSTIFAGKKNRDIPGFWYCYWSKPIFPPCSGNGVNAPPQKKRLGMILWESAAICSLKLSFCRARIIPQQPAWRVNWIFVPLRDAFNYFPWITLAGGCDEESLMLVFRIRNIRGFIPAPLKGSQSIPTVSHPEIPSLWSRVEHPLSVNNASLRG